MTIYIDVSAGVHKRAGLGRYAESLTRALVPQLDDELALFFNREQGIDTFTGLEHVPTQTVALGYKPWRMLVWMGQLARVPFNRLVPSATLFHAAEHLLLPLRRIPTVLTVHDLIFRHLPEHHKPLNRWYLNLTLPLYCGRADHIIAVSEATRRDVIDAYHISPEKITVVHEAADPSFAPQTPEAIALARVRYHLPDRFFLHVGTIEPRKNLTRLLHAWEPLYQKGEVPPLVLVGKRGWLTGDFDAALAASPARDAVHFTGYVANADLPAVTAAATALVFPTVFEGFGLPPLEAMACGTPVACSNTSSLPEVVGDAALTFDPLDEDAIAHTLRRIANNADLRADLRQRGVAQAANFSWDKAATETIRIYRQVMA